MRGFPLVADSDAVRVEEMRFRWRLLTSTHRPDVESAVYARFGLERAQAMLNAIDWSTNLYPGMWDQICALYIHEPRVQGPSELAIAAVRASRHWVRQQRGQRDTLALREQVVLLDGGEDGTITTRTVRADLFEPPRPLSTDPTQVGALSVWLELGEDGWERRTWDREAGSYLRQELVNGVLVTRESLEGEAYPWLDAGAPYIPAVLYHAAETGYLLDWETGTDVAFACVMLSVDFTNAEHAHTDASWPQRGVIDGEIEGGEIRDVSATSTTTARQVVVADPMTVLRVSSQGERQAREFQWSSSADCEALLRYCRVRAQGVAQQAGIRTPEVTRAASDIRSGYSLAVSRESMAELQLRFKQVFGVADRELLHKAALLLGEPSEGPDAWTVRYRPLRWAGAEQAQLVQQVTLARAAGLMTHLEAILTLHPDLTEEEAEEMIAEIKAEGPPPAAPNAAPQPANQDQAA